MGHHWQVTGKKYTIISQELKKIEKSKLDRAYLIVFIEALEHLIETKTDFIDMENFNKDFKGCIGVVHKNQDNGLFMVGFGKQTDAEMVVNISHDVFWYKKIA